MPRLTIVDKDGKTVALADIATALELVTLANQARKVISECEHLAQQLKAKSAGPRSPSVPYVS